MNNKIFAITAISTLILLLSCSGDEIIVNSDNNPNQISDIKPILKVYIENSGSMDGYMCDGSQLKDAIFDYVSDLSTCVDTTQLYYINNRVIPYHADLEQYIKTMNPITFQKAGGNRSNSDLSKMLSTVLDAMTDSTVSIFVSDCILDLPVSDAQRFLEGGNLAASKIRNLECPSYEICLIDYGCGKFNRKIHIMEQYP